MTVAELKTRLGRYHPDVDVRVMAGTYGTPRDIAAVTFEGGWKEGCDPTADDPEPHPVTGESPIVMILC